MTDDSNLYRELRELRQRQGVDRADLRPYIGPQIRRLLTGDQGDVRAAVEALLRDLIAGLPPYLRQAAAVSFALEREDRFPTLDDRVVRLADLQTVSSRTARRRMGQALRAMATAGGEMLESEGEPPAGSGWRVSSLRALYRLDTATPELYEMRTIVAIREIDHTVVRIGLPDAPEGVAGLTVDALFGARIRSLERQNGGNNYKVVLELPRTLAPGEKQEFWLRVVLPPGQPTWSHYAIVPLDPCAAGTVRVRFDPERRPDEIWLLNDVPYTDMRALRPGRETLTPSPLGEVSQDFYGMRQGHGYGIAWRGPSVKEGHVDR
jgi:hypothetical protein